MGEKLDVRLQFGMVVEGRQKSPPILGEILIAHVEGGSAAHYSSMTSSSIGAKPVEEGRDEEPVVAFCFECDWTMNSWVFRQYRSCLQSQSIMSKNSSERKYLTIVLSRIVHPTSCAAAALAVICVGGWQ